MTSSVSVAAPGRPGVAARRLRAMALVGAAGAALAVFAVAEGVLGVDLRQPAFAAGDQPQDLSAPFVGVVSVFAAAIGWLLLAALVRFTARAGTVWLVVAVRG